MREALFLNMHPPQWHLIGKPLRRSRWVTAKLLVCKVDAESSFDWVLLRSGEVVSPYSHTTHTGEGK
jgi:hypothetical protein